MQANDWDILILKPTYAFTLFLTQQLPQNASLTLPSLKNREHTAYIIKKQPDDNALLNEIERHFNFMLSYESHRVLPQSVKNLKGSFLDFLCCFKFEMHAHVIMMEEAIQKGQCVLQIKPRALLLKWLKQHNTKETHSMLHQMTLSDFSDNSTSIVKKTEPLHYLKSFVKKHYHLIYEAEQLRAQDFITQWPTLSTYQDFSHYFAIEIHKQVIELPSDTITKQGQVKTSCVS